MWNGRADAVHGPLTRYVKSRVALASGMPGTVSPLISDPGMHHGTCVTQVPWCMAGSLNCGAGENIPCIPDACATPDFTYLARGPWFVVPGRLLSNLTVSDASKGGGVIVMTVFTYQICLSDLFVVEYQLNIYQGHYVPHRRPKWLCAFYRS